MAPCVNIIMQIPPFTTRIYTDKAVFDLFKVIATDRDWSKLTRIEG